MVLDADAGTGGLDADRGRMLRLGGPNAQRDRVAVEDEPVAARDVEPDGPAIDEDVAMHARDAALGEAARELGEIGRGERRVGAAAEHDVADHAVCVGRLTIDGGAIAIVAAQAVERGGGGQDLRVGGWVEALIGEVREQHVAVGHLHRDDARARMRKRRVVQHFFEALSQLDDAPFVRRRRIVDLARQRHHARRGTRRRPSRALAGLHARVLRSGSLAWWRGERPSREQEAGGSDHAAGATHPAAGLRCVASSSGAKISLLFDASRNER